jgi:transcriptional regulator GlxA family with amidase domain
MTSRGDIAQQRTLDTAVGYVSRHLQESIRLCDLAAVAGVSTRTLGYLFTRIYGITPMAFVKHERLSNAYHLLQDADPASTTVAAIARRCGFSHMGQFAIDFKRSFGESPSVTLSQARRRADNRNTA